MKTLIYPDNLSGTILRIVGVIVFYFATHSFTYCQVNENRGRETAFETPFKYLSKDNVLPKVVITKEDNILFQKLRSNIDFLNAKKKEKNSMIAKSGIKFGYEINNKLVVPFGVYDFADAFGLGRKAIVAKSGKYGIIDEHGKLVLPLEYDFIEQPSLYSNYSVIFLATKQNKVTVLDENLNVIPITNITSYLDYNGNVFVTNNENKKGLVNYKGQQTIPFLYDTLYQMWSVPRMKGFIAKRNEYFGLISIDNQVIQPFKYKFIYVLNGFAVYVNQDNKVGMFDDNGEIMIPFEYEAINQTYYNKSTYDNLFPGVDEIYIVQKEGKIGTVDDKNNVIIPIIYDALSGWVEYGPEAHFVKDNDKFGLISHKGEIIIPIEYEYVGIPQNGIIHVRKNGRYGVISWDNKEIMPFLYEKIILDIPMFDFGNEEIISKIVTLRDSVWSYFDLNGKLLRTNIPKEEIIDNYQYILNWGEPSNEYYDFDLIQSTKAKEEKSK